MNPLLRLLRLLKPHRARFAVAIVFMVINSVATTLSFTLVEPFTKLLFATVSDQAVAAPAPLALPSAVPGAAWVTQVSAAWFHWLFDARRIVGFERLCSVILVLFLVKNLADYFASYLSVSVEQAAMRDLRRSLFSHLTHLSLDFYHERRAGTLISRSIRKPGQYSGSFPFDDNASWEKNAATLRQLHALRERIRALERKS